MLRQCYEYKVIVTKMDRDEESARWKNPICLLQKKEKG